jgi:metal-responsive CopG/Arc/MetJ family transcriptional regulator
MYIVRGGYMKRILVSLPDKVYEIIQSELKGKMGESSSEIVRAIVVAYLSEKGYMKKG